MQYAALNAKPDILTRAYSKQNEFVSILITTWFKTVKFRGVAWLNSKYWVGLNWTPND